MQKISTFVVIGLLACTACSRQRAPQEQPSQPPPTQQYQGEEQPQDNAPGQINLQNAQSYQGQIVQMIEVNDDEGSHLIGIILKTDRGTLPVFLGPRCYVGGGQRLSPGQEIEVTGVERFQNGKVTIIAKEATVNGWTIQLRDNEGTPLWSAWKRK